MKLRTAFFLVAACLFAPPAFAQLTTVDVQTVINRAVTRALQISPNSVIAVIDREGYVLGIWTIRGGEPTASEIANAVSKAGTAAFLSSNENAFTSRTAGFIIQQHFPPGVFNTPPGPLVGVGFSSLPFSDVMRFKQFFGVPPPPIGGTSPGLMGFPILGTSLSGSPGGVPLFKNGMHAGGVGVVGDGTDNTFPFITGYDKDEDIALAGQQGYRPSSTITSDNVFINGISLAYTASSPVTITTLNVQGNASVQYPIQNSPAPFPYPVAVFGGVLGEIRQPIIADPLVAPINGQPRLTAAEVASIINYAADRVRITRAGIRLPIGIQMEAYISVVNFPNMPGTPPTVLGTFRTGEATNFSWDVAVQKARTAIGFSNNGNTVSMSARTVGFLAESNFPPGIDAQGPGPYNGIQEMLSTPPPNPNFPNGITIFPGGFPLYRNGQMIGAIGVSGDGVDQDDIVAASGTHDFLAPEAIRADQFFFKGVRLPYAKFPRDPGL